MALITKKWVKYALAGAGAVYLVLFAGWLVYSAVRQEAPRGPSDLEAHPERQEEIVARRRAEELRDRLQLSEEQTQKIAEIYQKNRMDDEPPDGPPTEEQRNRWRARQEEIARVLTPEQQAQLEQERRFGGPGRPGGRITPERIEQLKQSMSPEQRERFEKAAERMRQFRGAGGGGRGPEQGGRRGGGRGPGREQPRPRQ